MAHSLFPPGSVEEMALYGKRKGGMDAGQGVDRGWVIFTYRRNLRVF